MTGSFFMQQNERRKHMKKGFMKRVGTALLAGLLCLTSLSLVPLKAQAANVTHGDVQILDTDYDSVWSRLKAKYPTVFLDAKVYSGGVEVGTENAVRVLITKSTTHLQAGNQGATEKYINGNTASTSNSAFGFPGFQNNETFTVNGHIGYCFDWLTPSRTGQHVASSSLAEAGINVRSGVDVIGLAEAAKMLTQNNFELITNNANQIAMSITVPASNYNESMTIPKSAVVALLQDTSADATAFKRGLVQMLVWGTMNDLPYSDYMYYFISASGFWDKEGHWHDGGDGDMITAPIIGIAGFIDIPKMYELGYQAYQQMKTSVTQTADWERQYELTVGQPFTVPAADVENIGKILDENGGKIEPSGTVQVSRSGQTITLTATQELSSWTAWEGVTEDSSMIYSSKPYDSSYTGSNGSRVFGSGQFIVDVSAVQYLRARVKAEVSDGYAYLQKSATVPNGVNGYSLEGAVYGLYASEANAASDSNRLKTLTTNTNGKSNTVQVKVGTYYVKEITAPAGFALDTTIHSVTVTSANTSSSPAVISVTDVPLFGSAKVVKVSEDGMVEGLTFKIDGPVVRQKETDASGQIEFTDLPYGSYTVTEILTAAQKKIYKAEGPWTFTLSASQTSYTVNAHNSLITHDVKVKKTAEDGAKAGFTFQLIGSTVNGMQITKAGTTDANGEIDFGQIPKGTYTIQEINVPDQYCLPDPQTITVADNDMTVTFANKLKVGTIEIIKKTDDGVLQGFKFHLSGRTIGGKTYEADATTNAAGKATFTNVPYGDYTVSEVDVPVRYIVPEDQNITLSTAGPATLTFVNETSGKVTVKKVSSDGIISGISFSLKGTSTFTGEEIIRSTVTNNDGVAVFENLPAGTYRIEESGVKEWYTVSPAYRDVTLAAGDEKEVNFTNALKTGSVKIIKTSEDGTLQGFTFRLEGYALNEKFYSFEATTDENGVALFKKVPIGGPYQVTEILNEAQAGLYKTVEIRDIFVQENETVEIPVVNELNRYAVRVIKTSESGQLKGFVFELSGTDIAGREVLLTAETNADGIAEFSDVAPGTYLVREINTPDYFVVPEDQTVTVTSADAEVSFHNEYQSIDVLIKKVNEDGVVEGFTFVLSGKAVSGENIYREVTTDAEGKATFERVPWGSYTISESYTEFQERVYLPTANRTLKVEAGSSDKTITWTNRLRKFDVSVVKTSENDDIEGKTFHLFGTSLTGVEIDITKKTDKDGYCSFGQVPLGEYTISEEGTPFWFVQPEDQEVVVETGDVTNEFYNALARGTILVHKTSEDSVLAGFTFRLQGTSYGGIEIDEAAITDENGVARFENIPYGEFTITEELNEDQAYVYVQNESFTVDLRTDEASAEVFNSLIRQKVQVVKTSENDEVEGITFRLHGETVNGMAVDEYATTDANGVAEFAAEKGGIPRGSYTVEEVDTKFYFIDPEDQSITVTTENLELSFWNELQKANLEVTKSSEDGILAGFRFHLYGTAASGVIVDAYAETDEEGKAVFEQIPWGICTLEEVLNEDQAFVYKVNASEQIELLYTEKESTEFHNELIRQRLQVIKTSENDEVEGITFHLHGETVNGMEVDEYATTDADGIAEFAAEKGGIPRGSYTVEEVDTKFYFIDPEVQTVGLSEEDAVIAFYNELQKADLEVIKSSEDGILAGFRFHLYGTAYSGVEVDTYAETDEDGKAVFEQIPWGEFTLEEVLNEGQAYVYKVNGPQVVTLIDTDHERTEFLNELIRQKVEVSKLSEDGQLAGFTFRLVGTTVNGLAVEEFATTNEEGIAEFAAEKGGIPHGSYTIEEVKTPEYFEQPENQEAIVGTDDISLSFFNRNKRGEIELVKKDADSEELLAGSIFSIYEWDGEGFVFLKDMTDNGDGSYIATELIWTKQNEGRFEVREAKAPEGYFLERNDGANVFTVSFSEDGIHPILAATNMKPEISTEVRIPMIPATEKAVITDTVNYRNLLIGRTYTVQGILMDKETGEPLLIDGKEVIAETVFTAETADGSVDVVFELDASGLAGKTLVVFESLLMDNEDEVGTFPEVEGEVVLVAVHRNIENEAQTVYIPKVWTEASDRNSSEQKLYGTEHAGVKDSVNYENLIPGWTYTVKGELMDKETGEATGILAEISFTAEEADGSIVIVFSFDGTGYIGKELVVFERIYDEAGNLIGIHEDLEDPAQTVKVIEPELPPKTGDDSHLAVWAAVAVGALVALIFVSRHFIKDDDEKRK